MSPARTKIGLGASGAPVAAAPSAPAPDPVPASTPAPAAASPDSAQAAAPSEAPQGLDISDAASGVRKGSDQQLALVPSGFGNPNLPWLKTLRHKAETARKGYVTPANAALMCSDSGLLLPTWRLGQFGLGVGTILLGG